MTVSGSRAPVAGAVSQLDQTPIGIHAHITDHPGIRCWPLGTMVCQVRISGRRSTVRRYPGPGRRRWRWPHSSHNAGECLHVRRARPAPCRRLCRHLQGCQDRHGAPQAFPDKEHRTLIAFRSCSIWKMASETSCSSPAHWPCRFGRRIRPASDQQVPMIRKGPAPRRRRRSRRSCATPVSPHRAPGGLPLAQGIGEGRRGSRILRPLSETSCRPTADREA